MYGGGSRGRHPGRRPGVRVERVAEADEAAAIALIRAHADKSYSLCDALSFVICERFGITQAISSGVVARRATRPAAAPAPGMAPARAFDVAQTARLSSGVWRTTVFQWFG